MDQILPKVEIEAQFQHPITYEELGIDDIQIIAAEHSASLFELGLTIWTHHLKLVPDTDPMALAQYVRQDDPYLYAQVEALTGQPALHDIYHVRANIEDPDLAHRTIAELMVARVYPGYLHISDVAFCNPYRPIAAENRRYQFQAYAGLGMFPRLLERLRTCAIDYGLAYISLVAAAPDLRPFFAGHGFEVEDNPAGHAGVANGTSVPMRLTVE